MNYSWMDAACIGLLATVAAVQFLRGTHDFSRVFYEMIFLIAAVVGASRLFRMAAELTKWSPAVCFVAIFLVLGVLGMVFAGLLNAKMAFGLGIFSYVFSLLAGVACGYVLGHIAVRTLLLGFAPTHHDLAQATYRSWMARELLHFRTLHEVLAILRFARYSNVSR